MRVKSPSKEKRPLGVPTLRDRIVQGALLQVIEPIFERDFAPQSYGFRPGKGCKDALRRVDELLKSGYRWVEENGLQLHSTKRRLVNASLAGGFDFLDYHFERGMKARIGSTSKIVFWLRASA